jgi:Na+-translocating ferredoxin:NAD+ oxidoreductase RnfD subunit
MAVTVDADARSVVAPPNRTVRLGGRDVPVVLPRFSDPRIHLAITTFTIITIGMVWLDFRLSIPQVAAALLACGLLDVARTYRAQAVLAWPASALQTATSTALILRVTGVQAHDWWSFDGWYYFAGVATAGVLTKYYIRYQGRHVFNPSNVALVAAFLVFGADRIEPLDFWWGPFGWAMLAAYLVIMVGGVTLCRRLRLLGMAAAFYATFVVGVGVLALLGQSITTQWSLTPIDGLHYWWVLVTSPETLIFLFFMITDPRTTPAGRRGRIAFGCAVGAASTLLLAPWETEFGTKVGLLSGLLVVTAVRPFVERRLAIRAAHDRSLTPGDEPILTDDHHPPRRTVTAVAALVAAASFVALVALAGAPNRTAAESDPPAPTVDFVIDPASLPAVSIDDDVAGLSAELATPAGARDLVAALAFNLQVEAQALATRDASLLTAVDHGQRLEDMRAAIDGAAGTDIVVPSYEFDTLHLSIVYPGGFQSGANAGLAATGTVTLTTYSPGGEQVDRTEQAFETTFSLRNITSDRWLTTDTPSPPTTN